MTNVRAKQGIDPSIEIQILAEKKRILQEGLPHLYGQKFYPWTREIFDSFHKIIFLSAANQIGKDLWSQTLIPIPGGFKKLEEIQVGDQVYGSDGKPCNVVAIPFHGENETYKVSFNDGTEVVCGPHHEWICKGPEERFRHSSSRYGQWQTKELKDIIEHVGFEPKSNHNKYSIPICRPTFKEESYLFDPYLIGLLIGDGSLKEGKVAITNIDPEVVAYVINKYKARKVSKFSYSIRNLTPIISYYGLNVGALDKSIPNEYKRGSIEQRLSLLQGLMDTDGYCAKNGITIFYTISEKLKDDVCEVVHSLGGWASVTEKPGRYKKDGVYVECNKCYVIRIKLDMPLFRIQRKLERQKWTDRYSHERIIVKIEPHKRLKTKCLTVDSSDNSYLCTKNYIVTHNSAIAIRKNIRLGTDPTTWPKISRREVPTLFFYFYPSLKLARREIQHKWIPEFLPRGEFQNHPQYGWKLTDNGEKLSIKFNTGVEIQFLGYSMGKSDLLSLAASSPSHITIDEEMPPELWPEVSMRLEATKGMLLFCATPVMCYPFYKEIFEGRTKLDNALIKTVSMYSCLKFEDGTQGLYTKEDVQKRKALLGSEAEIARRIFGKYMAPEGLAFESFHRERNIKPFVPFPANAMWFAGIDLGSGGKDNHPAAIVFVCVDMELKKARVAKAWRGNKNEETSNTDVLNKYLELRGELLGQQMVTGAYYDWAAKDFGITATRAHVAELQKANKDRSIGVATLNTLFKNDMLSIDDIVDNYVLIDELENLRHDSKKSTAVDDTCDALRYAVSSIPFDYTHIANGALQAIPVTPQFYTADDIRLGRAPKEVSLIDDMKEEFDVIQALYE